MNAFRNPWNPTITEIREWAYSSEQEEPCQDLHYSLRIAEHIQICIDLVADRSCLRRMRFLDVLYNTVQCWLGQNPVAAEVQVNLTDIAVRARRTGCYYLMMFADDVEMARRAGKNYDVDFWFDGGYRQRLDSLPKVFSYIWIVGARFPDNGLGLESPATIQSERTFGK